MHTCAGQAASGGGGAAGAGTEGGGAGTEGGGRRGGGGERRKVVGSVCCWRVSVMEPSVAEKRRLGQFCSTFSILTDQSVGGVTLLLQAFLGKIRDGNCL